MQDQEYEQRYQQTVVDFFDGRVQYDNKRTIERALPLLDLVPLQEGQQVLDVATGTGIVAIASTQSIGPTGQVVGVDFSAGMLQQAREKAEALNIQNLELIEADAEQVSFSDQSFDAIFCSSALVYFRDIASSLGKWHRWLKKGGIAAFSAWSDQSCEAPLIIKICEQQGIKLQNINEPTGTPEKCIALMEAAGFQEVKVSTRQLGYYSPTVRASAWNGTWFHPTENPLEQLREDELELLRANYRKAIEIQATEKGVWYESLAFFTTGRKR